MNNNYMPNSTQTLNIVYDRLMCVLSGAEFKVLSFLIRQTYGFNTPGVSVGYSVKQICDGVEVNGVKVCYGTGLSNRAVLTAVKTLASYGIIKVKKGDFKDGVANEYRLRFLDENFEIERVIARINAALGEKSSSRNPDEKKSSVDEESSSGSVKKVHRESASLDEKSSLSGNTDKRNPEETQGETHEIIRFQKMIFERLLPAFKNSLSVTDEMNLERIVRRELIVKNLDVLSESLIDEFFSFRKKHGGVKLEHFNGRYNDFDTFCANFRLKGGAKKTNDDDFFEYANAVGKEVSA